MSVLKSYSALLITAAFSINTWAQTSGNTFTDAKYNFTIEKPTSWTFVKNMRTVRVELLAGGETKSQVLTPRVAFRDVLKYRDLSFCSILEFQTTSTDALAAMTDFVESKGKADKGFQLLQQVTSATINGIQTAHAAYLLLTDNHGKTVPLVLSDWVFSSGGQMLRLDCSTLEKDFTQDEKDFEKIVQTLKPK